MFHVLLGCGAVTLLGSSLHPHGPVRRPLRCPAGIAMVDFAERIEKLESAMKELTDLGMGEDELAPLKSELRSLKIADIEAKIEALKAGSTLPPPPRPQPRPQPPAPQPPPPQPPPPKPRTVTIDGKTYKLTDPADRPPSPPPAPPEQGVFDGVLGGVGRVLQQWSAGDEERNARARREAAERAERAAVAAAEREKRLAADRAAASASLVAALAAVRELGTDDRGGDAGQVPLLRSATLALRQAIEAARRAGVAGAEIASAQEQEQLATASADKAEARAALADAMSAVRQTRDAGAVASLRFAIQRALNAGVPPNELGGAQEAQRVAAAGVALEAARIAVEEAAAATGGVGVAAASLAPLREAVAEASRAGVAAGEIASAQALERTVVAWAALEAAQQTVAKRGVDDAVAELPRLRTAIEAARVANVPSDAIAAAQDLDRNAVAAAEEAAAERAAAALRVELQAAQLEMQRSVRLPWKERRQLLRELQVKWHPDRQYGDVDEGTREEANKLMQSVNEAMRVAKQNAKERNER